jgi:hypothetical protein
VPLVVRDGVVDPVVLELGNLGPILGDRVGCFSSDFGSVIISRAAAA